MLVRTHSRHATFARHAFATTLLTCATACAPRYDEIVRQAKFVSIEVVCENGSDCDRDAGPLGFQYDVFRADGSVVAGRSAFLLAPPIRQPRSDFRTLVDRLVRTTPFLSAAGPTKTTYRSEAPSWIVTLALRDGSYRSVRPGTRARRAP